jgi:hypothetical protein
MQFDSKHIRALATQRATGYVEAIGDLVLTFATTHFLQPAFLAQPQLVAPDTPVPVALHAFQLSRLHPSAQATEQPHLVQPFPRLPRQF